MLGARLFDCLGFYVWLACRATHTGRLCFFALFGVRFSALMCAVGRGATARRFALDLRVDDRFLTKHGCDRTERNACDAHRCADRDPRNLLELHVCPRCCYFALRALSSLSPRSLASSRGRAVDRRRPALVQFASCLSPSSPVSERASDRLRRACQAFRRNPPCLGDCLGYMSPRAARSAVCPDASPGNFVSYPSEGRALLLRTRCGLRTAHRPQLEDLVRLEEVDSTTVANPADHRSPLMSAVRGIRPACGAPLGGALAKCVHVLAELDFTAGQP